MEKGGPFQERSLLGREIEIEEGTGGDESRGPPYGIEDKVLLISLRVVLGF